MHPSNLRRHKKSKNNRTKFTYDNRASEGKQINKKSESFVCSLTLFSSRKLRTSQIKTGRNLFELQQNKTTNFIENWKITNYITFPPANSL